MARARRLVAGAMTAFAVAGASLAMGLGPAAASSDDLVPVELPTCLLPLPILCDEAPEEPAPEPRPGDHEPDTSWSHEPEPGGSWPRTVESGEPWRPASEHEHRVPKGHPETGGGGLASGEPVWPFALGGTALLAGAGLAGLAVRRRKGVA
ncbi:hypothetical protein E1267_01045 [Nonomuraea longispora]|uniref:LPXTG cell wall anchor domain-containing protein n=1 Tax=Nonomuraea longispora TaxID=1848320 RepID=A0A4R4NQV3_9ACTN|nr:hypothetical protein [Nonomuraea longispora]TDC11284.1 hypothetical protein E1267_01045 [Nonomuraea longispora]